MPTTISPTRSTASQRVARAPSAQPSAARIGPLDRLALHLGVALVAWSRRPRRWYPRTELARRFENARAREIRERDSERGRHLLVPPR